MLYANDLYISFSNKHLRDFMSLGQKTAQIQICRTCYLYVLRQEPKLSSIIKPSMENDGKLNFQTIFNIKTK